MVGAPLGDRTDPDAPRRVFPLEFDAHERMWDAYDGGLVRWMKENLMIVPAAA